MVVPLQESWIRPVIQQLIAVSLSLPTKHMLNLSQRAKTLDPGCRLNRNMHDLNSTKCRLCQAYKG